MLKVGRKQKDIVGLRVGIVEVMEKAVGKKSMQTLWTCRCACGRWFLSNYAVLTTAQDRKTPYNCGCLRKYARKTPNTDISSTTPRPLKTRPLKSKFVPKSACELLYNSYKGRAKFKKFPLTISLEEFNRITQENCAYCAAPPSQEFCPDEGRKYIYNGIDRIDNEAGYAISNCLPCCGVCNRMKSSHDQTYFLSHIRRIYENLNWTRA